MAIDVEKLAERYERTGHMNPRTAIRWLRDLQSDLAAARARIAELEKNAEVMLGALGAEKADRDGCYADIMALQARLASLTSVSEEDVEWVAQAIGAVQLWDGYPASNDLTPVELSNMARAALTAFVRG